MSAERMQRVQLLRTSSMVQNNDCNVHCAPVTNEPLDCDCLLAHQGRNSVSASCSGGSRESAARRRDTCVSLETGTCLKQTIPSVSNIPLFEQVEQHHRAAPHHRNIFRQTTTSPLPRQSLLKMNATPILCKNQSGRSNVSMTSNCSGGRQQNVSMLSTPIQPQLNQETVRDRGVLYHQGTNTSEFLRMPSPQSWRDLNCLETTPREPIVDVEYHDRSPSPSYVFFDQTFGNAAAVQNTSLRSHVAPCQQLTDAAQNMLNVQQEPQIINQLFSSEQQDIHQKVNTSCSGNQLNRRNHKVRAKANNQEQIKNQQQQVFSTSQDEMQQQFYNNCSSPRNLKDLPSYRGYQIVQDQRQVELHHQLQPDNQSNLNQTEQLDNYNLNKLPSNDHQYYETQQCLVNNQLTNSNMYVPQSSDNTTTTNNPNSSQLPENESNVDTCAMDEVMRANTRKQKSDNFRAKRQAQRIQQTGIATIQRTNVKNKNRQQAALKRKRDQNGKFLNGPLPQPED